MLGQPSVLCLIGKAGTALSIVSYWKGWVSPQYYVSLERLGQPSVLCLLERLGQPSVLCLIGKAGTALSILSTGKAGTALSIVSYWKGWDSPQYCVLVERLGHSLLSLILG